MVKHIWYSEAFDLPESACDMHCRYSFLILSHKVCNMLVAEIERCYAYFELVGIKKMRRDKANDSLNGYTSAHSSSKIL